jgi:hypothetical protein
MMVTRDEETGLAFVGPEQSAKNTGKLSPSQTRVPSAAKWLGALGAIPFVFFALAGLFVETSFLEPAHFSLATYGAIILSFLGGIHWGLAIADADQNENNGATFARLAISVVPSLVGWGALLLSRPIGLAILAAAFLVMLLFDLHASRKKQTPAWYPKLRRPLTVVVVASLAVASLA